MVGDLVPLLVVLLLCSIDRAEAQVVNTKLVGIPKVRCGDGSIRVTLQTNDVFEGNVYAKGFFESPNCRVSGDGSGNLANITIPIAADCGIRRLRTVEPKGITFEITVVLMLHRRFLTRNDRAFMIQCSYLEQNDRFTNKIEVDLASSDLSDVEQLQIHSEAPLPKCRYDVLTADGKTLMFATLGSQVMHRWSCESSAKDALEESEEEVGNHQYCLTVHSCDVSDGGKGDSQKLLDANGCPIDKSLMDAIDYSGGYLEASYKGFVFKFADKPTIYFSCALRLELKEADGTCSRTSDRCQPAATNRQSLSSSAAAENFARTSLSYDFAPDFPTPRTSVTGPPPSAASEFLEDSAPADENGGAEEEAPAEANDSQSFLRRNDQIAEMEEEEAEQQQEQQAERGEGGDREEALTTSNERRFAASLKSAEHEPHDEQLLDVPLPTLPLEVAEVQQRHRATTPSSPQSSETRPTQRMFGRAAIEMDVNSAGIDVVDVSEAATFDQDGTPVTPRTAPRMVEIAPPRPQVCISRQTLSTSVLAAAVVLLMISILFCAVLWRFVRRPRVLIVPRDAADRPHQLLSAFHA
ncbi:CBN-CUTL-4 protein [Aphelenchoides fujianensis]|nr:CBN-CUTL-4 protein [Aphelenchoides fujianensis]